jgi:hypothetical protein
LINASKAFKNALAEGKILYEKVDITFADGRKKTLDSEILVGGGTFTDCAESSSFPIGATVCKSMTLSIDNTEDQWKDYYFYKAKLTAYLKMQVTDSVVETIKKGTYTITTPEQYGEVLEFTALDDMYKANAPYTSNLALPQSAFALLLDACTTIGISMGFSSMEHGDVVVNSIPDGITFRQLIGWVAMLDSANARVDINGNLQLIKWNFDSVSVDYGATVGADGYLVFGGESSADSNGFISPSAGNWYLDSDGYLTLKEGVGNPTRLRDYLSSPTLSSDDVVITGIKVKNTESDAMYGKDGYVLELENNLLSDADLETVAGWIGDNLIGKSFRSMEGSLIYNPLTEFGDMAFTYDRKENKYITPITDVSSRLNGTTDVKTKAENPIRGSSKFLSSADKTLIAAKKIIENEKTAREQAVKKLEDALANSEGLFETLEVLEDKSVITYLHDKPLLEESKVVIKLTSNAIGVSNDGGETYPYGFVVDGTLITRLLYAEGINADYILFGTLKGIKLEAVTGDITGEFTSTSTSSWGKEYIKIKDAIISAGLDGIQKSLIDMVAQYEDGLHLVIKNDTEINIEAPVLKILTDILNIGDGKISITQKSLAEAQVNVANTDISGRLVASGGKNFGLYNVTSGSWVIKSNKTGIAILPATTITGITTMSEDASVAKNLHVGKEAIIGGKTTINNDLKVSGNTALESLDVNKNEYIAGTLNVDGTSTFKSPPKLYNLTHVTTGGHLVMGSDGASIAYLGSSSLRYKDVQGVVEKADLESLYQIKVVWAKYKNEYLDASDERYGKEMPMFLAEDIDRRFPLAVDHDEQGRAENWNYRVMIPCMFAMIKSDHEKISSLQSELENMKSELQELKKLLKGE